MWKSDKWYVSPYNSCPEVLENVTLPEKVIFSDCTLREGEQQPGVVLSRDEKLSIAHALDELGIQFIEVGMPAVSEEERATIQAVAKEKLNAKVVAVCRMVREDVTMALEAGADAVILSVPFGEPQIEFKLKWPKERIIEATLELVEFAHTKGLYVVLSPYDTTRADLNFLLEYLKTVSQTGFVDRVRLVDTVGGASPQAIAFLVRKMRDVCSLPIEVHCHDDFGLATANTIAAVCAGAEVVSTTVNGMGERSGGAATEEVAMALWLLYGVDTGLKYEKLYEVSQMVQRFTGVAVQPHKSIVGRNSFAQEAGLVVGGLVQYPFTAEPFLPELVGQRSNILLGKKSGKASILFMLKKLGLEATEEEAMQILAQVKERSQQRKSTISEEEFSEIVKAVKSSNN